MFKRADWVHTKKGRGGGLEDSSSSSSDDDDEPIYSSVGEADDSDEEEDDDDDDMPDSGLLPFLALFCMPCVGVVAVNKQKEIPRLHSRGEALLALDTAKRASHIGFLGVVFGTMLWMVVFGLIIKPQIASEPPCDNYPDCVPDEWLARTIAGSPPE